MEPVVEATESIEDFFARYTGYLSEGDIETDVEVPGVWVGRLVLENLDGSGSPQNVSSSLGRRRPWVPSPARSMTRRIGPTSDPGRRWPLPRGAAGPVG